MSQHSATEAVDTSPFDRIDPAVLAGDWTWCVDDHGQLQFRAALTDPDAADGDSAT